MIYPTIHRNGSSRTRLELVYHEAARAVDVAIEACAATAPNARDYYVQSETAFAQAQAEHEERMADLRDVRDALLELRNSVKPKDSDGPK